MARIDNMVSTVAREIERLGVEVVHTEIADMRHAAVVTDQPPKEAAVKLSRTLPGCIFLGGSHISWACSNFAVAVHTVDTWSKLEPVRRATSYIIREPARYGVGSCARQLVNWLGPSESPNPKLRHYVDEWHFQHCEPCRLESAYQFDLSACYFTLLKRLPSLYLTFSDDEIFWRVTPPDEAERFARIVDTVAYVKPLRNALIGAMYGGSQQVFLKGGKPQRFRTAPGGRPSIAAAIVRTAYEVCQLQAELCEAVYANVDSVISPHDEPSFWKALGLPYKLAACGPADVQAIGKYRVGDKATKSFQADKSGSIRVRKDCRHMDAIYWRWLTESMPLLS